MSITKSLCVIALCGIIFYSCSPDENKDKDPKDNVTRDGEKDNVRYIRQVIDGKDTLYVLDLLQVKVDTTLELVMNKKPGVQVCLDTAIVNKKETILFFQNGVTNKDEYIINNESGWCVDIKIKYKPELIGKGKTENYTFAGVYNYADTVAAKAKYIHKNSVCKIRIQY